MNQIYSFGLSMVLAAGIGMSANATEYALVGSKPADGAVVKSFNELTLLLPTWDEEKNEPLNFTFSFEKFYEFSISKDGVPILTAADLEDADCPTDYEKGVGLDFPVYFLFSETLTEDGEYTIHVPAGCFIEIAAEIGGEVTYSSAEYTSTFTISSSASAPLDNYIVTPASGTEVKTIESVSLVFPEVTPNEWDNKNFTGTFSNGSKDYKTSVALDSDNAEGHLAFTVTPVENGEPVVINKADDWSLTFEPGTIALKDGTTNQSTIRAYYIVTGGDPQTGIESITTTNGKVTVFSLDGNKVIDNAAAESIGTLSKGVYVINGRKVLVK